MNHLKVLKTFACKPRPESGLDCLICGLDCLISGLDCLVCVCVSGLDCLIRLDAGGMPLSALIAAPLARSLLSYM